MQNRLIQNIWFMRGGSKDIDHQWKNYSIDRLYIDISTNLGTTKVATKLMISTSYCNMLGEICIAAIWRRIVEYDSLSYPI